VHHAGNGLLAQVPAQLEPADGQDGRGEDGYAGLVDGLVDRMKAEMAGKPKVIATGGNARLIAGVARSLDQVNEDLGLEGLRILWTQARGR